MDDDAELDLYGDLGDFDLGEKLREANQQVTDLTDRLDEAIKAITQFEAENKLITREKRILSKNTSSLLLTAKQEIQRKDREIQSLRREKEDICFRRGEALAKSQNKTTASAKESSTISVQTDLSFAADDCIDVQRIGQFKIKFNVKSSEKEYPDNDGRKSQDHRSETVRSRNYDDRNETRHKEQRNPFGYHSTSDDRRRKSIDCRPSRSDSDRRQPSRSDSDREKKHETHDRVSKRSRDSDNDDRYTKRPRNDSSDRSSYRSRRDRENDYRASDHKPKMKQDSSGRSHSASSDKNREIKASHANRPQPLSSGTDETKNSALKQADNLYNEAKTPKSQIDYQVARQADKDFERELVGSINIQSTKADEKTNKSFVKTTDSTFEKHNEINESNLKQPEIQTPKAAAKISIELPNQADRTVDLSVKKVIAASKFGLPSQPADLHSHSPDSTTLIEDPKPLHLVSSIESLLPLPSALELFKSSKAIPQAVVCTQTVPADPSLKSAITSSQTPTNIQPIPSALLKCDTKTVVECVKDKPQTTSPASSNTKPAPTTTATSSIKRKIPQQVESHTVPKQTKTTDDILPTKPCKPITTRRKTVAAVPRSSQNVKQPTSDPKCKPSEPSSADSKSNERKSTAKTKTTIKTSDVCKVIKKITTKKTVKESVDNQNKPTKAITRSRGENKNSTKEHGLKDVVTETNPIKKSPLNILFDELNDLVDLGSKHRSNQIITKEKQIAKDLGKKTQTDNGNKSKKSTKPLESMAPLVTKVNLSVVGPDSSSEKISSSRLSIDKPQNDNSIEQKLANLFGSETSDSEEHPSPKSLPNSDLRPCIDNTFNSANSDDKLAETTVNFSIPSSTINICETPIASLVEHMFSNNNDGDGNDANVSDASSTSLRVAGESVEQIDLYLTRRKRRSSGKYRFRQHLAVAELNSSTESKTMDLSDNHTSVSMDVDIELTQKCVHDAQAQSSSIISLFDALHTPRKTFHNFERVEDKGSLFANIHSRQQTAIDPPERPNDEVPCTPPSETKVNDKQENEVVDIHDEETNMEPILMNSNRAELINDISLLNSNPIEPTINHVTGTTQSNKPIAFNTPSSIAISEAKFLADQSLVPSHHPPSTMDQSFLNIIPVRTNQDDRVANNHYEEYLSNVKINDLSTLSDFFTPENVQAQPKPSVQEKQSSANTPKLEQYKQPDETASTDNTIHSPPPSISPLPHKDDQTKPLITTTSQPETSANPISITPISNEPSPTAITTPTPLHTSITSDDIATNLHNTSTGSHTKTARLSYYVEEDTTNNEVTMFITRKKKKKPKK